MPVLRKTATRVNFYRRLTQYTTKRLTTNSNLGNDIAVYPIISLHEIIIWNPTMLLIKEAKTMFIIVFTMILIVATMIYIVLAKIGNVFEAAKVRLGQLRYHLPNLHITI